ncbi:MAG: hypothetical protein KBT36_17250 [Kurthia sp.]|nr:hypothetical protein [Candidatus Kurthia equi]
MTANELMVYDWAIINEDHPDCPFTRQVDIGDLSFFTKFEPIPLTEEILKANGFNYDGGEIWDIRWEDEDGKHLLNFRKMYNQDNKWDALGIMAGGEIALITSVHELQHVLRTYGLKELANNFKIE